MEPFIEYWIYKGLMMKNRWCALGLFLKIDVQAWYGKYWGPLDRTLHMWLFKMNLVCGYTFYVELQESNMCPISMVLLAESAGKTWRLPFVEK